MSRNLLVVLAVAMFGGAGCSDGSSSPVDAGDDVDSGVDACDGGDAGYDGGIDAGPDGESLDGDDGNFDAGVDAGFGDGNGDGDGDGDDGGDEGGDEDPCAGSGAFDYSCDPADPDTCPEGFCILGMCIGPVLDPNRWDDCGDGNCGICESEESCPADCGQPPATSGEKEYDNATTITVWVHGFYNKSPEEVESMVYGEERGCSGILGDLATYGVVRPCGDNPQDIQAPDHLAAVEYYGAVPAAWLEQDDIDEIEQYSYEGTEALQRYALIVAKFIRRHLDASGATHVNMSCHSMGCLISRHMIEHNLENLAAENRLVRWFTSAGVIGGAQLARLYDNPTIRDGAQLLGMELNDFVIMHPDFVQDHTCIWDHKLHQGNNPLFGGMLIHHGCACDPHIQEAIDIALLDLHNPDDMPNDGIMYTDDEYFHAQTPAASFQLPDGEALPVSRNLVYVDHMTLPESDAARLLATAGLFHARKVFVTLDQLELLQDRENHEPLDGEHGEPPAEIIVESSVRYNPYVADTFGKDILVHDDKLEYRTPAMFTQDQGTTVEPGLVVFAGPVFDDMQEISLQVKMLEVDWYPRMQVSEWIFDHHQILAEYAGQVPLVDNVIQFESAYVRARLAVRVVPLY